MSNILHTLFVIIANVICWGMLIAGVVGFLSFFGFMISDNSKGSNPHNPGSGSGMPWG